MTRGLIWALNGVLIALCAFLTAGLLQSILAGWLGGTTRTADSAPRVAPRAAATWDDRRAILDKNLFQVSTLLPTPDPASLAPPPGEELEETQLPLRLLGTMASTARGEARAAIENQREGRKIVVVQVGDEILDGVRVVAVERRRIVLENSGRREALSLDEEDSLRPASAKRTLARASARTSRARPNRPVRPQRPRSRPAAEPTPTPLPEAGAEGTLRSPAAIASQAQFLPKYDEETRELMGVEVNSIKAGSLLEEMGVREGDLIVQFNGLDLESGEDSAELLRELADADTFEVQVIGSDGEPRLIEYSHE